MTTVADGADARMTIVEHLAELRNRLIKIVVAVVIGMAVAFFLYEWIFDILIQPYCEVLRGNAAQSANAADSARECGLLQTDPLEGFSVRLKVSGYAGIALAMPVILWQIWRFVTPGLYDHEKKYAIPFVLSALVLFVLGAGLAFYTLPKALDFLATIGGENLRLDFRPAPYFQLVTYMMLAFGIGFEFPIVLLFLQLVGVLDHKMLASGRRFAIVGIVVLVAVITPSGDPYSLLILSVPMYLFYEMSIIFGRLLTRKRRAREDQDTAS